jgi:glycosyltransferase involved in cell wall biosynthesis
MSQTSVKTLVVSFYQAYPPSSGAASVTWNCARHAPGERVLIQMGGLPGTEDTPHGVRVETLTGARGRFRKLVMMRRTIKGIVRRCGEIDPDVIILEGASWAVYLLALLRQLRRAQLRATIVYHAHNVEYLLRREKHGRIVTWLTWRGERALFHEADVSFVVSDVDACHVQNLYGVRPKLLPNGVDTAQFRSVSSDAIKAVREKYGLDDQTVLFMGFYAYRPNQDAVDRLVTSIFPQVVLANPAAKLAVIGSEIPYRRPWLLTPGRIPHEELASVVAACAVGVAPIRFGSGTRLKILEYLAAGLPVVSTAKGAEGLGLQHEKHLLIAEADHDFSDAINQTLTNRTLAAKLGQEGQAAVSDHYAWPRVMRHSWVAIEKCHQGDRR